MHKERLATGFRVGPQVGGAYSAPPDSLAGFKRGASRQGRTWKGGREMDKGGKGISSLLPPVPGSAIANPKL